MAVAVKNTPETSTSSAFDRTPIVCLAGVVYVLSSLAIVFGLIPYLWNQMWGGFGFSTTSFASGTLAGLVMLAVFSGLVVLGGQLLGPKAPTGVRAGIFTGLVGFLLVLGLTRWFSLWVEYYCFYESWFGTAGETVGAVLTSIVGLALLVFFLRWFFLPSTEKFLASFEEQGWFSGASYKKNQGMRVRRGTIIGLLVLFGSGVFTLVNHKTLDRGPANWDLNIPFTGKVTITAKTVGDARPLLESAFPAWGSAEGGDKPLVIDRYVLREINARLDPERYVKIDNEAEKRPTRFADGEIVLRSIYEKEKLIQEKEGETAPDVVAPTPAWGATTFASLRMLPSVSLTIPLLLLALSIWFAWRVVNLPGFADFLIATEAELNKVSWTTRKKLYQDTIVVLVTVVLMAFYLFAMDQVWGRVLSWRPIGVIVFKQEATDGTKGADQKPW